MTQGDLDAALLAAHAADDRRALVALYTQAAEAANAADATGFYLTHAYIFALDTGHPQAARLHARLKTEGREE